MALGIEQIEALIEKNRALAIRERKRIDELERTNENVVQEICTSLTVPASAFGMSYARAYYGERASLLGIPIDACVGLFMHGIGALFGLTASKGGQKVGKFFRDIANGAFASWTAALGAEYGAKKRIETPVPAPQPNTGAAEMPPRPSRAMTHDDLAAIKVAMASNTQPAMPQQLPAPAPLLAPAPPPQPFNEQPAPLITSETPDLPPAPQKPFRFTQRWAVDPEADMRALLQSVGAPSDPNTVNHLLAHENPGDELRMIMQRARAPA